MRDLVILEGIGTVNKDSMVDAIYTIRGKEIIEGGMQVRRYRMTTKGFGKKDANLRGP